MLLNDVQLSELDVGGEIGWLSQGLHVLVGLDGVFIDVLSVPWTVTLREPLGLHINLCDHHCLLVELLVIDEGPSFNRSFIVLTIVTLTDAGAEDARLETLTVLLEAC